MPVTDTSGQADNAAIERLAPGANTTPPAAPPVAGGNPSSFGSGQANSWNFRSLGAMGGLSRTASSEELEKGLTAMKKFLTEKPLTDQYVFELVSIDNTRETSLSLSSIVIAGWVKGDANNISYHSFLLEGSGEALGVRTTTWNNRTVTIDQFAAEVYNPYYAERVRLNLAQRFPNANELRPISFEVVPRGFEWDKEEVLRELIVNGALAIVSDRDQRRPDFEDAVLTTHMRDEKINTRVNFSDEPTIDATQKRHRSDIQITMTSVSSAKVDGTGPNQQEKTTRIARISAYIDALYAPMPAPQNSHYYGQPAEKPPLYAPHLIITRLENDIRPTTQSSLLALAGVLALAENQNWIGYFNRHSSRNDVSTKALGNSNKRSGLDPRDVGALNFEQNIENNPSGFGGLGDTKTLSVNDGALAKMVRRFFRPNLVYSLDVSEGGADTWVNEVYAAAANGDSGAQQAILLAADRLTGGKFGAQWGNSNESPVVVIDNRVFEGYYVVDGVKRDIRDLDYIAVANMVGPNNPPGIQSYSDTITALTVSLEKRMEEQKKIIQELIQGEVTFTGRYRRVTFSGKFIDAFGRAINDTGYRHQLVGELFGNDYNSQRQEAGFVEQAIFNPAGFGLSSGGFTNNQNAGSNFGSTVNTRQWR